MAQEPGIVATPEAGSASRFTFRKAERLCSRRLIDSVFQQGQAFNTYPLRFVFRRIAAGTPVSVPPSQVLFSVSKRHFKRAHDRNRVKRLLREAWRHEKARLQPAAGVEGLLVAVVYIGREKPESLSSLLRRLRKALDRLLAELPASDPPSQS